MKLAILAAMIAVLPLAEAGTVTFRSPETAVPLIELYTSEGCSSCPPAETWLSSLLQHKGLWHDFVPVAFHVDYWDYLGWRDAYAAHEHTTRQRAYAAIWGSKSIYTPGFVHQGKEWRDWHMGLSVSKGSAVGVLACTVNDSLLQVEFHSPGTWDVHVCRLSFGVEVPVKAGENAGRTLRHDFVVTSHQRFEAKQFPLAVELAKPPLNATGREALAIWISSRGSPIPVQATGGWLPK